MPFAPLTPCYVLVCNEDRAAFIPCFTSAFEATTVQLADYLKAPGAYKGVVYTTSDLREAKRALAFARAHAEEWSCSAHTIGIFDAAEDIARDLDTERAEAEKLFGESLDTLLAPY